MNNFVAIKFLWVSIHDIIYEALLYHSGYSSVTGCVLTQAIHPALQNLGVFLRKMKAKRK